MSEPVTNSPAINQLISHNDFDNYWSEFRDNATTDFEKWFYNNFRPYNQQTKEPELETKYSSCNIAQELFDKYVPRSGKARTSYGEFIRAYHKLFYRWLNDGDDPIYGPYSALVENFLEDYRYRHFKLHDGCLEMYGPMGSDFNEQEIENFLSIVNRYIAVFDCPAKEAEFMSDRFFAILDCLNDKLKDANTINYDDCADYYKNSAEYHYPKVYEFITTQLHLYNLRYVPNGYYNQVDIEELDDIISVRVIDRNQFEISLRVHLDPDHNPSEFTTNVYDIDLQLLQDEKHKKLFEDSLKEMQSLIEKEKEFIKKRYGSYPGMR